MSKGLFSRLSIFHKMLIAPLLALVLFSRYMIYVYAQYHQSVKDFEQVRQEHFPIIQIANSNLVLLEGMKKSFQDAISANEASWLVHAKQTRHKLEKNLATLSTFNTALVGEDVQRMQQSLQDFFTLSLKLSQQMMRHESGTLYDDNLSVAFYAAREQVDEQFLRFKDTQISSFNAMIEQTNSKRRLVVFIGLFIGLFSLFSIISVTLALSFKTRQSLNALIDSVQRMADGNPDFSRRLSHDTEDEVGTLVKQFNRFTQKLEADHFDLVQAKGALEIANTQLEKLSTTDGLTGVFKRRYFDTLLERLWHELTRSAKPLSLIMIDIDFFKKYNDYYGHQQGDSCLQAVAHAANEVLRRATDTLCRYGGEEFSVVIEGDEHEAVKVCEMIQEAIATLNINHEDSPIGRVSLSMGVATLTPSSKQSSVALVALADEALYQSKEGGRNRYSVANV